MGERSAAEAALVKAKPYTGETVEVEYVGPVVDPVSNTIDSSYTHAYEGSDKAHGEKADASGNVKGSYSFKTVDGQDFEVKYTSGIGGFVVENLEELLAKSNPQSAEYAAVVAEHAAIAAEQEALASDAQTVIAARSDSASAPAAEAYIHEEIEAEPYIHEEIEAEPYIHEDVPYVHEEFAAETYIHDDGSSATANTDSGYNFAYNGENAEREESADAKGLIKGSYKYTNAEGNNINVVYEAGSGIGFVVKNQDDLNAAVRKATDDGAVAASRQSESSAASSYSASALPLPGYEASSRAHNIPTTNQRAAAQPSSRALMDASFMFNAIGDDHEFMEAADVAGERTGSYSYVNPEGDTILVKYTAGKDGFVILNPMDVLPQAPVV